VRATYLERRTNELQHWSDRLIVEWWLQAACGCGAAGKKDRQVKNALARLLHPFAAKEKAAAPPNPRSVELSAPSSCTVAVLYVAAKAAKFRHASGVSQTELVLHVALPESDGSTVHQVTEKAGGLGGRTSPAVPRLSLRRLWRRLRR
jgi:hypothetical protein